MTGNPDRYQAAAAPSFTSFSANNPFQNANIKALGFYAQDDMRFGKLNLLAGLRYDTVKSEADSMNNGARARLALMVRTARFPAVWGRFTRWRRCSAPTPATPAHSVRRACASVTSPACG